MEYERPIKHITMGTRLYDLHTQPLEVENPFPADCEFVIRLKQDMVKDEKKKVGDGKAKVGARSSFPLTEELTEVLMRASAPVHPRGVMLTRRRVGASTQGKKGDDKGGKAERKKEEGAGGVEYPHAFGIDRRGVRVKDGDKSKMTALFLPFLLGKHRCYVVFTSETFGEFCYELIGEASTPVTTHSFKLQAENQTNASIMKEVFLPFSNPFLESAKRLFLEKHPLSKVQIPLNPSCRCRGECEA